MINLKNNYKNKNGITLIVLSIISVVLIILVGLSIALILNKDKKINQDENIQTANSKIEQLKKSGKKVTENTEIKDVNGNKIIIPDGFKIAQDSGISVTEGIVIEDDDIIEGIGNNRGNQYVWIPVSNINADGSNKIIKNNTDGTTSQVEITLGRYTFSDRKNDNPKGKETLVQSGENYSSEILIAPYYKELVTPRTGLVDNSDRLKDLNTTSLDLKEFIDSVKKNGGFYIARYEASYGIDKKANSKISDGTPARSSLTQKTEGMLWNYISQIDAATASRGIYTNKKYKTDLVNSYAWDTAICYIQKFSENLSYSKENSKNSAIKNTGIIGDEICKINDMASNIIEWTTEYSTSISDKYASPCVARGGIYSYIGNYTSSRYDHLTVNTNNKVGFRIILYI